MGASGTVFIALTLTPAASTGHGDGWIPIILAYPVEGSVSSALVLKVPGLRYIAPNTSQPRFAIEVGPLNTAPNYFGISRTASGAIVDLFPKGTDPAGIAVGNGLSSAVIGTTGRAWMLVWMGPADAWTYRITYPIGLMSPDKEVTTISEIPFEQGKFAW